MSGSEEIYGADGRPLSTFQKIQLLMTWAPLLSLLEAIPKAPTNQAKAIAVAEALRWLAAKTKTPTDDQALDHLESVLKTDQGAAIADFIVTLLGALA